MDCDKLGDEDMMEQGEDMMDEMLGHEDHERIEEAMEKDMNDHDSMHTMMGMWATGCIGDEAINTINSRSGTQSPLWAGIVVGALAGFAGGWAGGMAFRRKDTNVPQSSTNTQA